MVTDQGRHGAARGQTCQDSTLILCSLSFSFSFPIYLCLSHTCSFFLSRPPLHTVCPETHKRQWAVDIRELNRFHAHTPPTRTRDSAAYAGLRLTYLGFSSCYYYGDDPHGLSATAPRSPVPCASAGEPFARRFAEHGSGYPCKRPRCWPGEKEGWKKKKKKKKFGWE